MKYLLVLGMQKASRTTIEAVHYVVHSDQGWRQAERPTFDVQHLKYKLKVCFAHC